MKIFVSGTDTDIGKTLVCSWLCLHGGYKYFKPIQTGTKDGTDSEQVKKIIGEENIIEECYKYTFPAAPYLSALKEREEIEKEKLRLPKEENNLIIEGAGGLMVPINKTMLMVDLIKYFNTPVILVAGTGLGTINHSLLSIHLLKNYRIPLLGVILSGSRNEENEKAIATYGNVEILAHIPFLKNIDRHELRNILPSERLKSVLKK